MREVAPLGPSASPEATLAACIATILELPLEDVPELAPGEEVLGSRVTRWLSGLGLGLVPVTDPASFSWPGPWIGRLSAGENCRRLSVVMYGVPSGVAWDPAGVAATEARRLEDGFVISALDVALARPAPRPLPSSAGRVEEIWVSPSAGAPAERVDAVRALAGRGLEGDRYVTGAGTFPSGVPGSALTLIEDEVCRSFEPALAANEHRRNVVTRGIDLNALVGHEFSIGEVHCRGMRLCEPCTVVDGYASRPVLRALVHRGGLRADILSDGTIRAGDAVRAAS